MSKGVSAQCDTSCWELTLGGLLIGAMALLERLEVVIHAAAVLCTLQAPLCRRLSKIQVCRGLKAMGECTRASMHSMLCGTCIAGSECVCH